MDKTEGTRRRMIGEINAKMSNREILEEKHGQVWSTDEVTSDFEITGFLAPFVVAIRQSDGVKGTLLFQDTPRFYYGWREV